jgi:CHAT domain-containing protein
LVRAQGRADIPVDIQSLTTIESRKRALEELLSAVARERQERDVVALVNTLNLIGKVHLKLNDPESASATSRDALSLSKKFGDTPLRADTLIASGVIYSSREDYKTALRLLDEALNLSMRLKYRRGEAQSLTELAATYYHQSEMERAADYGERALKVWREMQDRQGEAQALYNLGAPYMRRGRTREASDALEAAATIWRESGNLTDQASALIALNFLAIREGQWRMALTLLNQISPLITDKGAEPFISGQIATSFGEVYEAYGQLESARRYFDEALTLYRDYAHEVGAAVDASRKAGRVRARLGDYQGAVQQIVEGLRLARQTENRFMASLCHEDLGRVHLASGRYDLAKQEILRALSGYEKTKSRREWARAQTFLGQTYYLLGDWGSASQSYRHALRVFQKIQDYTDEAAVHFGLGKLELEQQRLDEAGVHLRRSIDLTERLRGNAASKDLRSSFLSSFHDRYETYVEWLMQLHAERPGGGFDVAAFEASEMGRARSLLDSLRDYQRELRQVADPALLIEEEASQKEEQRLLDERAKLQSENSPPEALKRVETELMRVRTRYETLEAQINSSARVNDLLQPPPLSFADIRNNITDGETSLLEFTLGARKSYLWVVTPGGLTSYELPDKRTIERAALKLADLLSSPPAGSIREEDIRMATDELSRLTLGPVAGKLNSRRLIVIPDGILQYIPFQVLTELPGSDEPLIAHHEIINAPSASTLVLMRQETSGRPVAPNLLAAFGDPVFPSNYALKSPATKVDSGEQRGLASNQVDTLDPNTVQQLFFAKQELNVLRNLAPPDETLIYSDFDATRERLRELDLRQYRILHFATHGLLNARQPELSGLVLSLVDRDGRPVAGFVGLADIYNLRAPVDLVVLSACRTALGQEMRGEGLIGLTRGFMYAGASSVVASLWKVDDEATAELMKRFYSNLLQRGMTPAAALREAQNSIRQEPQWRSPYYWAAFTLQGEYRQVIKPAAQSPALGRTKWIAAVVLLTLLAGSAWRLMRGRGKSPTPPVSVTRR